MPHPLIFSLADSPRFFIISHSSCEITDDFRQMFLSIHRPVVVANSPCSMAAFAAVFAFEKPSLDLRHEYFTYARKKYGILVSWLSPPSPSIKIYCIFKLIILPTLTTIINWTVLSYERMRSFTLLTVVCNPGRKDIGRKGYKLCN